MEEPKKVDLEKSGIVPESRWKGALSEVKTYTTMGKDADIEASGLESKSGLSTNEKLSSLGKHETPTEMELWKIELLKDPSYVDKGKNATEFYLFGLLEKRLSKSLGRMVNVEEIKYPFLFSYAAIFWQKVVADPQYENMRNEELWRWTDILISLIEAVEGGCILPDQYLGFINFTLDPRRMFVDEEIRSILQSGLVENRPNNLVSKERIKPLKLLEAPTSISEVPLYLVPLLAYCALFPKGHRLVKEKLINLWMAEGFLLSFDQWAAGCSIQVNIEVIGDGYFNELVRKGVFHKCREHGGRVYDCEIHPLAHDIACQIAGTEVKMIDNSVHRDKYSMGVNEASHIAFNLDGLQIVDIERVMTQNSSARTCLFFGNTDAQSPINLQFTTQNSNNLRVLDLYGTHVDELSLPPSRLLRYLGLPRNRRITNLEGFDALETLAGDDFSLVEYYYRRQTCIRRLYLTTAQKALHVGRQLRMLELSHCKELNFITFDNLKLRRLRIYDCPKLVSFTHSKWDQTFTYLEELVIDYCTSLDFTGINSFPKYLRRLRYLELTGLPMLVNLPAGLISATALENLMIVDCPSLKSTAKVLQNISSLKKLCIYNCPKLLALGKCPPNLHTIDIRRCLGLIESYSTNKGDDWEHIPQIILDGVWYMSQARESRSWKKKLFNFAPRFIGGSQNTKKIDSTMLECGFSEDSRAEFVVESVSYFSLKMATESKTKRGISELYSNLREMKLHCLIFPNDYEFEKNTLIQLWMAAEFFMSSEEDIGLGCFSILLLEEYILFSSADIMTGKSMYRVDVEKLNNLFVEDKYRHYAMLFDSTTTDDLSNAWHVSVVSNRINGTTFQLLETITGLKTLKFVLNDYGCSLKQVPYSLFTVLPSMQVLDLSRSHITELPCSIGDVRCLRYLDLSFTLIEKLPESIGCITNLQTLKLKGCKQLYTLPKGLKELMSLVHLEFDEHSRLTCMPKGIGALTQLRTLSAFIVGGTENDCGINELQSLKSLGGSLCISGLERVSEASYQDLISDSNITRLQLQWSDFTSIKPSLNPKNGVGYMKQSDFTSNGENVADKILKGLTPPVSIKELQILSFPGSILSWLFEVDNLTFIERITLLKCENLDIKGSLGRLPNLEYLSITQMNSVKKIGGCFGEYSTHLAFPKLEELVINGMFHLESWTGVAKEDFPLLKKFTVMHCPKLSSLPFLPFIRSLQYLEISSCKKLKPFTVGLQASLETLIINDCPLLKSRCSKYGEDWNKIMRVPQIWIDQMNIHSPLDDINDEDENSIADSESDEELDRFKDLDSLSKLIETRAATTTEEEDNGLHSTALEC